MRGGAGVCHHKYLCHHNFSGLVYGVIPTTTRFQRFLPSYAAIPSKLFKLFEAVG